MFRVRTIMKDKIMAKKYDTFIKRSTGSELSNSAAKKNVSDQLPELPPSQENLKVLQDLLQRSYQEIRKNEESQQEIGRVNLEFPILNISIIKYEKKKKATLKEQEKWIDEVNKALETISLPEEELEKETIEELNKRVEEVKEEQKEIRKDLEEVGAVKETFKGLEIRKKKWNEQKPRLEEKKEKTKILSSQLKKMAKKLGYSSKEIDTMVDKIEENSINSFYAPQAWKVLPPLPLKPVNVEKLVKKFQDGKPKNTEKVRRFSFKSIPENITKRGIKIWGGKLEKHKKSAMEKELRSIKSSTKLKKGL